MTLFPYENADDGWDVAPRLEEDIVVDMPTSFEAMSPTPAPSIPRGRNVLSAEEIEALLRPDLSDMDEVAPDPAPQAELKAVEPVDLPDLATPATAVQEEDDSAAQAADLLATLQRIAARLSLALRQSSGLRAAVTVRDVAAQHFDAAVSSLEADRGRAYACFTDDSGEVVAMLCISGLLAGRMIEGACGGAGARSAIARVLTPIDIALLEALVRPIGSAIAPKLSFARIEIDGDFAASLAGPIDACIVDLNLRLKDEVLPARLIMCETLLLPELVGHAQHSPVTKPARAVEPVPVAPAPQEVSKQTGPKGVTAVMTARVATLSVPLSRLADLKPGSTLLLGVPADQPVALLSGGRDGALVAEGKIGRKGNRMAICVSNRGPALR